MQGNIAEIIHSVLQNAFNQYERELNREELISEIRCIVNEYLNKYILIDNENKLLHLMKPALLCYAPFHDDYVLDKEYKVYVKSDGRWIHYGRSVTHNEDIPFRATNIYNIHLQVYNPVEEIKLVLDVKGESDE